MENKKGRIGYTTGVFDMFHIGHLQILKNAKKNCDYLIVGVSSDELVQNYKNKTPIIPFEHRAKIVSSIVYVDEVVVQRHRDKVKAFHDIGFNVMFVGDDWKGSELFEQLEKELDKFGACVEYFPYSKNISSTLFRKILQDIYNAENLTK